MSIKLKQQQFSQFLILHELGIEIDHSIQIRENDLSFDISKSINLSEKNLKSLPFKINTIVGDLNLSNNRLIKTKNLPNKIIGTLDLSNNHSLQRLQKPVHIIKGKLLMDNCNGFTDAAIKSIHKQVEILMFSKTRFINSDFRFFNKLKALHLEDCKQLRNLYINPNTEFLNISNSNLSSLDLSKTKVETLVCINCKQLTNVIPNQNLKIFGYGTNFPITEGMPLINIDKTKSMNSIKNDFNYKKYF